MIRKNELQCCHRVLPRIELVDDGLESDDGEEPGREPEDPGQAEDDEGCFESHRSAFEVASLKGASDASSVERMATFLRQ